MCREGISMCLPQSQAFSWTSAVGPGQREDTGQGGPLIAHRGCSYVMFLVLGHSGLNAFDFWHLFPSVERVQQICKKKKHVPKGHSNQAIYLSFCLPARRGRSHCIL